ncbi:MAG: ABC transporter ATP-binding protein [Candidatus Bathyarchaeota archaeon]|nr:ABC transporter ATP-binding protein [Candidatus Bathyarchaeota archaeon]
MLKIKKVSASYGLIQVLKDISFEVKEKEIVSIIGPNGAGKSTLVKTIMGIVPPISGEIWFENEKIHGLTPYSIVKKGITLIPEGRKIFPKMTVEENLMLGAYVVADKGKVKDAKERGYQIFPILKKKAKKLAKTLSGGQQQMLVIGRSLMSNPKLLILDEPSLGLAPILVEKVLDTVRKINEEGVTILLVEQNIRDSLDIANRGYVIEQGQIVLQGKGKELLCNNHIKEVYLGL